MLRFILNFQFIPLTTVETGVIIGAAFSVIVDWLLLLFDVEPVLDCFRMKL